MFTIVSDEYQQNLEAFGKAVRRARLGFGMTQNTLARRLEVPLQFICDLETGKARLSFPIFFKLRRFLGDSLQPYSKLFTKGD